MRRESLFLAGVMTVLVAVGLTTVYSANSVYENVDSLMIKHAGYLFIGVLVLAAASQFDYHRLGNTFFVRFLAVMSLVLLVAVLVPGIGIERNGARRWINVLGFVFQPSEVAKFALLLFLAAEISRRQEEIASLTRSFLPNLAAIILVAGLIVLEKDLGTPAVLAASGFVVLFIAGTPLKYLGPTVIAGAAAVVALVASSGYRARRMLAFLDPWSHRNEEGFQLIQSMTAFVNGGYWGAGPGAGEQKLFYLPMANTDFIFAVWGEETGVAGAMFLATLYVMLCAVSLRIAQHARDTFGMLLAGGVAALIGLQSGFNMMVAVGLLPTKGLPLPFISMGGTSLVIFLGLMGIVLNVGLQAEPPRRRLAVAAAA